MSVQREKVAEGIWRRRLANGAVRYEITYRDSDGKQLRTTTWRGPTATA